LGAGLDTTELLRLQLTLLPPSSDVHARTGTGALLCASRADSGRGRAAVMQLRRALRQAASGARSLAHVLELGT